MSPKDLLLIRLHRQGLLGEQGESANIGAERRAGSKADTVAKVLEATVGMQAQQQRQAEIGLGLRAHDLDISNIQETYASGAVVRGWAQRWTQQMMMTRDWAMVISARQGENLPNAYYLCCKDLVLELAEELERYLAKHDVVSRDEVNELLEARSGEKLEGQLKYAVLQTLTARGEVVFDPGGGVGKYVLRSFRENLVDREEALSELIPRYLTGFGPASVEDFAKWAGVHIGPARKIWNDLAARRAWDVVEVGGQKMYSLDPVDSTDMELLRERAADSVVLTAGFDALLTGYVDKSWLVPKQWQSMVWGTSGILQPLIIVNGQVAGIWRLQIRGSRAFVRMSSWAHFNAHTKDLIVLRLRRVAEFLGKELRDIEWG